MKLYEKYLKESVFSDKEKTITIITSKDSDDIKKKNLKNHDFTDREITNIMKSYKEIVSSLSKKLGYDVSKKGSDTKLRDELKKYLKID